MVNDNPWKDEKYYLKYLNSQRNLFAWCLATYGDYLLEDAIHMAENFYVYQSPEEPYRGLVFHDEPWHWAMLEIFGEHYWISNPNFAQPSIEYLAKGKEQNI